MARPPIPISKWMNILKLNMKIRSGEQELISWDILHFVQQLKHFIGHIYNLRAGLASRKGGKILPFGA